MARDDHTSVLSPTGAERVVSLKMEIPGSMPPLIEEMLEEHQEKQSEERKGRRHSDTHTVSSQHMNSSDFSL